MATGMSGLGRSRRLPLSCIDFFFLAPLSQPVSLVRCSLLLAAANICEARRQRRSLHEDRQQGKQGCPSLRLQLTSLASAGGKGGEAKWR